ncbi:MAG TPA: hypothetical protein VJ063_21760, partial [Verrucomicrobiae bacterium]|nr:hypothetical protein [Verrucomicrobiae bacterium]
DGTDQLEFRNRVNLRNTLDTRYPDGPFTFTINAVHDGQKIITIPLTGDTYPPTPRVTNLPSLQFINANGYIVVYWEAFVGGTAADFIQLHIENSDGDVVFETRDFGEAGALDGTATYTIIEPGTLKAGTTYDARLRFDKTTAYGITTYVGVPGWSTHHAQTRFAIVTSSAVAPTIKSYTLAKARRFDQQSTNTPIPDLDDEYVFSAAVKFSSPTGEISVTLFPPIGDTIALGILPGESSFGAKAKTQAELDTAYPNGNYTFSVELQDGTRAFAMGIDGDAYPPVPRLTNFDPTEEVRADRNLVFEWEPWVGGVANDFVQFHIEEIDGTKVFETKDFGEKGGLTGRATWVVIPAHTLKPGRQYKGRLQFTRVVTIDTGSNPGALGTGQYYSRTKFVINTGPNDLIGFRIVKGREYRQTAPDTVVADGEYSFSAVISAASTSSLQTVSLEIPGHAAVPLPVQPDGQTYSLAGTYASQQALDAAYPNGTYRLTVRGANDGWHTLSADIVGDAYPNAPVINDYGATAQIFTFFDLGLSWSPFEGGRARDFIFLDILDPSGALAYVTSDYRQLGSMDGLNTDVVIPAEVLWFNTAYTGRLMFERVAVVQDPGYPEAEGRAGYFTRTRWTMLTLGDGNPTSFARWSKASDGTLEFNFPSVTGGTYVIEGSRDLVNWLPVTTINASGEQSLFRVQPGLSHFFYRAALTR